MERRECMLRIICFVIVALLVLPVIASSQIMTGDLEVFTSKPEPGEEIKVLFKIQNSNFTGHREDVHVKYSILGPGGELINSESATFPVTDSRDIVLNLNLPADAMPGMYSFIAEMTHDGNSKAYEDTFEIPGSGTIPLSDPILLLLIAGVIGLVFLVFFIARRGK